MKNTVFIFIICAMFFASCEESELSQNQEKPAAPKSELVGKWEMTAASDVVVYSSDPNYSTDNEYLDKTWFKVFSFQNYGSGETYNLSNPTFLNNFTWKLSEDKRTLEFNASGILIHGHFDSRRYTVSKLTNSELELTNKWYSIVDGYANAWQEERLVTISLKKSK